MLTLDQRHLLKRSVLAIAVCAGVYAGTAYAGCRINDPDISASYSGDCIGGGAHGTGVAKGRDEYRGQFKNGNKHGQGTYRWGAGSEWAGQIFVGEFVDDNLKRGTLTTSEYVAAGEFEDGKLNGRGAKTFFDGSVLEGTFKDGNLNRGTLKTREYVADGEFKAGKLNGRGTVTFPGGKVIEGTFKDNVLNGRGTLKTSEYVGEGEFKDSELINGKITFFNGDLMIVSDGKYEVARRSDNTHSVSPYGSSAVPQYASPYGSSHERKQLDEMKRQTRVLCQAQKQTCYAGCRNNDSACRRKCFSISCY